MQILRLSFFFVFFCVINSQSFAQRGGVIIEDIDGILYKGENIAQQTTVKTSVPPHIVYPKEDEYLPENPDLKGYFFPFYHEQEIERRDQTHKLLH